jgi:hypothetical protein
VRLEDELVPLGERSRAWCGARRWRPPGRRRILAELGGCRCRIPPLDALGLLASAALPPASTARELDSPEYRLVCALGQEVRRLPISRSVDRYARTLVRAVPPADSSPRAIHRFRRATEPWALDALAYAGAGSYAAAVEAARRSDPAEPLVRGTARLRQARNQAAARTIAEQAAGTITTRDEAIAFARARPFVQHPWMNWHTPSHLGARQDGRRGMSCSCYR